MIKTIELNTPYFLDVDSTVRNGKNHIVLDLNDIEYEPIELSRMLEALNRYDHLEAELKELREFVGAMDRVLIDGHVIENQDGEWWVFRNDGEGIASGTDPADAYRNMKAGEGE